MCPAGELCSNGKCGLRCTSGLTLCSGRASGDGGAPDAAVVDGGATGLCVNVATDRLNCGGCGKGCPPGESCSGSTCTLICPGAEIQLRGHVHRPQDEQLELRCERQLCRNQRRSGLRRGEVCSGGTLRRHLPGHRDQLRRHVHRPQDEQPVLRSERQLRRSERRNRVHRGGGLQRRNLRRHLPGHRDQLRRHVHRPQDEQPVLRGERQLRRSERRDRVHGGEVCSGGTCGVICPGTEINCGGTCIDPKTSSPFCGASGDCAGANAGTACTGGEVCSGGTCGVICPGTEINCGGTCIDPKTSSPFCGASGDCAGANAGTACAGGRSAAEEPAASSARAPRSTAAACAWMSRMIQRIAAGARRALRSPMTSPRFASLADAARGRAPLGSPTAISFTQMAARRTCRRTRTTAASAATSAPGAPQRRVRPGAATCRARPRSPRS